jgi:hypothetical protein
MLTCPMCKKRLRGMEKQCQSCKADVSLLVHYVENLAEGLARAEAATRAGELGDAVWAYLEVLEVDPDNATARRQVGKVATAVRQFDDTAPGRRFLTKLHRKNRWKRWLANAEETGSLTTLIGGAFWFLLVLGALLFGYVMGVSQQLPRPTSSSDQPPSSAVPPESGKAPATEPPPPATPEKGPPSVKPEKP